MKKYIGQGIYVEKSGNRYEIFNQSGFVNSYSDESQALINAEKLKQNIINQKNDIDLSRRKFSQTAKNDLAILLRKKVRLANKFTVKKMYFLGNFVNSKGNIWRISDYGEYINGDWKFEVHSDKLPYKKRFIWQKEIESIYTPKFVVALHSVPNQDILNQATSDVRQAEYEKQIYVFAHSDSLKKIKEITDAFIKHFNLGGGNWMGAKIFDSSNRLVGEISYNLRIWDRRNGLKLYSKELKEKEL